VRLREARDTSILSDVELRRDLPKAKTPHEREIVKRQVAATDRQSDAFVYDWSDSGKCRPPAQIYGLTEDEIRIVGQERNDSRSSMGSVPSYPRLFTPGRP